MDYRYFVSGLAFVLCSSRVTAQVVIASDHAGEAAYADGWQLGDNGGFGFEPWRFDHFFDPAFSPYSDATFLAENAFVDIPNAGPAFGHTNGNRVYWGYTSWSIRPFSSPLESGESFSIDVDNPILAPLSPFDPPGVFIRLRDSAAREKLTLLIEDGLNNSNWTLFDAGAEGVDTGLRSSATANGGLNVQITMMASETYELKLTSLADGAAFVHSGDLRSPGQPISEVSLVMYSHGSAADGSREL